jgi:hypothetical protein
VEALPPDYLRRVPVSAILAWLLMLAADLAGGMVVSLLAFYIAQYGPTGPNWSFRGNGALSVYALLPAVYAAGWTALALRSSAQPIRPIVGLAAGVVAGFVGILLATADAALLPVFGSGADRLAGPLLLVAVVAWACGAPFIARRTLPVPRSSTFRGHPPEVFGGSLARSASCFDRVLISAYRLVAVRSAWRSQPRMTLTANSGEFVHPVRSFRTPRWWRAGSGRRRGFVGP